MNKLLVGMLLVCGVFGQTPEGPSSIALSSPAPSGVSNLSAFATGVKGQTNYCYWVVTVYGVGMVASNASVCVTNSNATLTGGNFNTISWQPATGAIGYWVIRANNSIFPGTGTVSVSASVISATTFTINNTSNTLNSFTFSPAGYFNAHIRLENGLFIQPRLLIDTPINSTTFALLPTAASASGLTYLIIDASTASTCNAGGGTNTPALCWSNGSSYIAIGGGGGGTGPTGPTGPSGPTGPTGPQGILGAGALVTGNITIASNNCGNYYEVNGASNITITVANPVITSCPMRFQNTSTTHTMTFARNGLTIAGAASDYGPIAACAAVPCPAYLLSDAADGVNWQLSIGAQGAQGPTGPTGPSGGSTGVGVGATATSPNSLPNGAFTAIQYDTQSGNVVSWDTSSGTIHSTSSNKSRFVATSAGRWQAICSVQWVAVTQTGAATIAFEVNGAGTISHYYFPSDGGAVDNNQNVTTTGVFNLAINDYVECFSNNTIAAPSTSYVPYMVFLKMPNN